MSEERITLDRKSFEALAGETRVKILKTLLERRKTLTEISDELTLSVSSIKEQLETLESAGFVTKMDDGHKWKYYELTKKAKDVLEPREIRVMVLLGLSVLALFLAVFFLLPQSSSLTSPKSPDNSAPMVISRSPVSPASAPLSEGVSISGYPLTSADQSELSTNRTNTTTNSTNNGTIDIVMIQTNSSN